MDDPNTTPTPQPATPKEQATQQPTSATSATSAAPTGATPTDGGAVGELALLLLDPGRFDDNSDARQPQLLVGQVAPDFPFAPPLPDGARIVGSYLHGQTTTVVLDAPLEPTTAWEYYRDHLAPLGWRMEVEMEPHRHGGFTHSSADSRAFSRFFQQEDGPLLTIMAVQAPSERATVHLTLEPPPLGGRFNTPIRRRQMRAGGIWSVLPTIQAPPHARQFAEGGSGGDTQVGANASLETDLGFAALVAHYQAQLEHGGWRRLEGDASDPVAWSSWSFTDDESEPWSALFVLLRRPSLANRYYLTIRAEWMGTARRAQRGQQGMASSESVATGWTVYGPMSSSSTVHSSPEESPHTGQ